MNKMIIKNILLLIGFIILTSCDNSGTVKESPTEFDNRIKFVCYKSSNYFTVAVVSLDGREYIVNEAGGICPVIDTRSVNKTEEDLIEQILKTK